MTFSIECRNVTLSYKKFEALKNISFKLRGGKIYGLIGRNGAGKTTLLSLLAAFREATSGSITIDGENPFENPRIMQHTVFLYDTDYQTELETVRTMIDNVERYRPYFDKAYAFSLVERFKLPLDKQAYQLSKGMQSALNVTMGLSSRAPLTIFDESYLGMDAPARKIFYEEILEEQENHPRTFILSTHLVSEMDYLFDEVLILNNGDLLLHEDFESLANRGFSIIGSKEKVRSFTDGMKVLSEQQLGGTKAVTVYGQLSNEQLKEAAEKGLEIGSISLQELFIHLTGEEDTHDTTK